MRGTVERIFRTCAMDLLPRLSGRTFSDIIERGDHPAEERACLGPEDLCVALVRWVVDIYHNRPHAGLGGRTPLRQWENDHEDGNFPLRAAPDTRAKRLAFGLALSRRATREGITVLGVRYHSGTLAAAFVRRGATDVDVRWDPEDIGSIEACIDGKWLEVPAVHHGFDGIHAQVWISARRTLRSNAPRRAKWEEGIVDQAIQDIVNLNEHCSLKFRLIDKGYTPEHLKHL
jgi:putative transposase